MHSYCKLTDIVFDYLSHPFRFLPMSPSKFKTPRLPLTPRVDVQTDKSLPLKSMDINSMGIANRKNENPSKSFHSRISRKISFKKDKTVKNETEKSAQSPPKCHIMKRVLTSSEIKDTWKSVYIHE